MQVDIDTNETSPVFQDLTAAFGPNFPHNGLMVSKLKVKQVIFFSKFKGEKTCELDCRSSFRS